jgi:hypothetical protein
MMMLPHRLLWHFVAVLFEGNGRRQMAEKKRKESQDKRAVIDYINREKMIILVACQPKKP